MRKKQILQETGLESNQGFSMVEVLIAVSVLAIGILAITHMQLSSARYVRNAADRTMAVNLGIQKLEELMSRTYADLTDPAIIPPTGEDAYHGANGMYDISWDITTGPANTEMITTTVAYGNPGNRKTVTLTTLKPDMNCGI